MKKILYIALGALFTQGAITLANDSAVESEIQHDRYCENVAWYELTQYEETPVGHRDYKEDCTADTVNHFKIKILGGK